MRLFQASRRPSRTSKKRRTICRASKAAPLWIFKLRSADFGLRIGRLPISITLNEQERERWFVLRRFVQINTQKL
jgi:hypothetical protein